MCVELERLFSKLFLHKTLVHCTVFRHGGPDRFWRGRVDRLSARYESQNARNFYTEYGTHRLLELLNTTACEKYLMVLVRF